MRNRCTRRTGAFVKIAIASGLFTLLFSTARLRAAGRSADVNITIGFDGAVGKSGSLFPVVVTVANKIRSTAGIIEIVHPDASGKYEVVQRLAFTTPAPSDKRFLLLDRRQEGRDLEVRVTFDDYLDPVRKIVRMPDWNDSLILCADVPATYLAGIPGKKYKFVRVTPNDLHTDPLALDGVHCVMLNGRVFAKLGRGQVEALRQWVATGGTLVMYAPIEDDFFRKNLEAMVGDVRRINVRDPGVRTLGSGIIAGSGQDVDPRRAFWEDDPAAMKLLFPEAVESKEEKESVFVAADQLSRLFRTGGIHRMWSIPVFVFIVVCYVLTIGPLDRWAVRKLGKPHLTWGFFSIAIALFSVLSYWHSRMANPEIARLMRVNVVDASPDAGVARGRSTILFYSARNASYAIETSVDNVCFSARESDFGAGSLAGVEVMNGRRSAITARIPIFSAKTFDAAWYAPWRSEVSVEREEKNVRVTVPADLKVDCAYLVSRDGVLRLDNVDGKWVSDGSNPQSWLDLAVGWSADLASNAGNPVPSGIVLQNYLIRMSFPPTMADVHGSGAVSSEVISSGALERCLNIRSRLAAGRTLLLFLRPSNSLLPVSIGASSPAAGEANLVRMFLADGTEGL